MALTWTAAKDPNEVKDYVVDWSARLTSGDTIMTSTWEKPDGIIVNSEENTTTTTTLWLSGGSLVDEYYEFVNIVETNGGRTYSQTCKLKCKAL